MGVYIDIKMPRNCTECPCLKLGEYQAFEKSSCGLDHLIKICKKGRPEKCPLRTEKEK